MLNLKKINTICISKNKKDSYNGKEWTLISNQLLYHTTKNITDLVPLKKKVRPILQAN